MIQRVQSLYLLISVVCLSIVSFGSSIIAFETKTGYFTLSSYGVQEFNQTNKLVNFSSFPFYISIIILILLCILTIFSYKNLKQQLKFGRLTLFIYFLLCILLVVLSFMGNTITGQEIVSKRVGLGFFLFATGLPFVFLANVGIKRDKNLLDSLNRLR
jgi:amino acid transporter